MNSADIQNILERTTLTQQADIIATLMPRVKREALETASMAAGMLVAALKVAGHRDVAKEIETLMKRVS